MRKSRFTEEQIIKVLKEHAAGLSAGDVCRKYGISDATFYKWRSRYGGMEISDARKLKALEDENRRLKKLLAAASALHSSSKSRTTSLPGLATINSPLLSPTSEMLSALLTRAQQKQVRRMGHWDRDRDCEPT